jgi:hypothetical protein
MSSGEDFEELGRRMVRELYPSITSASDRSLVAATLAIEARDFSLTNVKAAMGEENFHTFVCLLDEDSGSADLFLRRIGFNLARAFDDAADAFFDSKRNVPSVSLMPLSVTSRPRPRPPVGSSRPTAGAAPPLGVKVNLGRRGHPSEVGDSP